jgi:hypothetical protein
MLTFWHPPCPPSSQPSSPSPSPHSSLPDSLYEPYEAAAYEAEPQQPEPEHLPTAAMAVDVRMAEGDADEPPIDFVCPITHVRVV